MKRVLLLGVAALLSLSALLAIAILLAGRFGSTQGKILGSTALLAGYGLVALPAAVLLDQGRCRRLALASASLAAAAAAVALAGVWSGSETAGKAVGSLTAFALAGAQVSALVARRRERDPLLVRRLFAASCVTGLVAAASFAVFIWLQPSGNLFPRLFGSLLVLDLLLVALQPILARARPAGPVHHLTVRVESGEPVAVRIEGGDLAGAAAKAIRSVERDGRRVVGLEVSLEDRAGVEPRREPG
ncbi:MAG TPA: hypothetical protein VMS63_09145 [Gaiellaceae bacterium]|nr:hypothetical protein [Gaiellaceae bacterium]